VGGFSARVSLRLWLGPAPGVETGGERLHESNAQLRGATVGILIRLYARCARLRQRLAKPRRAYSSTLTTHLILSGGAATTRVSLLSHWPQTLCLCIAVLNGRHTVFPRRPRSCQASDAVRCLINIALGAALIEPVGPLLLAGLQRGA